MSTAPSPSSEIEPIVAIERSVTSGRMSSLTLNHTSTPFGTSSTSVTDADFDAGDADRRPAHQARDVGKLHLERIVLPEEPAAAADGEDQQPRHHEREDGNQAELQLGPGE